MEVVRVAFLVLCLWGAFIGFIEHTRDDGVSGALALGLASIAVAVKKGKTGFGLLAFLLLGCWGYGMFAFGMPMSYHLGGVLAAGLGFIAAAIASDKDRPAEDQPDERQPQGK